MKKNDYVYNVVSKPILPDTISTELLRNEDIGQNMYSDFASEKLHRQSQQTFQRCFNVVFWLMRRRDVGQRQINVETMLRISTLEFTTSNNVESTLCISTLT